MGHRSCPEPGHDSLLVIPLHVLVDRLRDFRIAAEVLFVSVIHLLLQLREQVLRLRVVQAVPFSRPGLDDAVLLERRPVGRPLVLPALIRMEDPACRIGIFPVQAGEPVPYPLPVRAHGQAVGQDLVVAEVDDRREVDLAEAELPLGHVRSRLPEAGIGMEVPLQDVGRDLADRPAVRAVGLPVAGEHRTDVPFLPQSQHLLVVDRLAVPVLQGDGYLPVSVSLLGSQPYRLDFQHDPLLIGVFLLSKPSSVVFVGRLAQPGQPEGLAQPYLVSEPFALEELFDGFRLPPVSRSAKAFSFFRYSTSNLSRRFSCSSSS